MVSRERITHAAVRVRGRLFTAANHKAAVLAAGWAELGPNDIGFVTSTGRFVSRAEAWKIARRAGQLRRDRSRQRGSAELHSEDLS